MHFSCLRIFSIAVALVLLAVGDFGELAMSDETKSEDNISINCTAEDDRAALICNDDLLQSSSDENLFTIRCVHNPKCAIVASRGCIVEWEVSNETDSDQSGTWKFVHSLSHPMVPVFDSRCEGFPQDSFPSNSESSDGDWKYLRYTPAPPGAIVFSVRGKGNVNVTLCNDTSETLNSCFWVTIPNGLCKSEICIGQILHTITEEAPSCSCKTISSTKYRDSLVNETEWRTFSLEWTSNKVKISSSAGIVVNETFEISIKAEYLFVGSRDPGKIRYHDYHYLLAEKKDSKLSTSEFNRTGNIFCIELLVSLCSTCELDVQLVDSDNFTQKIGTITGNQSADSNLPTCKLDKLNVTLEDYRNPVQLEILSIMKPNSTNGRWAVDSFRECQPIGNSSSTNNSHSNGNSSSRNNIHSNGNSNSNGDRNSNGNSYSNGDRNSNGNSYSNGDRNSNGNSNSNGDRNLNGNSNSNGDRNSDDDSNAGNESSSRDDNNSDDDSNPGDDINSAENSNTSGGQYGPLEIGLIFLVVISTLATCALLLLIFQRECSNSPRSLHRENLSSRRRKISSFVRRTAANRIFQDPPFLLSTINNAESLESISTTEAESGLYSHCVIIKDFEDYVKKSIPTGLLRSQFKMLPKGLVKPCKHGSLPENFPKNRYHNILPYDHSRVKLQKVAGDVYSDYINANYVHGFQNQRSYIAAQGPTPRTTVDFWRMIWQTKSLVICMLANVVEGPKDRERVKCAQYWPDLGDSVTHGDIVIVNEDTRVFCDFTFRTFRVACGQETRMIEHMHYTSWPDHGVPLHPNSVISYLKKMQTLPAGTGPIVVHCSAGIGRTGTIILCDICFHRANAEGTIDVLAEFEKLRNCRSNMVDNELQYMFAHVVLVEWLVSLPTELPCNDTLPQMMEELKNNVPDHIERLEKTAWQEEVLHALVSLGLSPPEPLIVDYPTRGSTAVIVDGVRTKNQYLVSQLPSQSILSHFWKFIEKQGIELVIILQRPDPEDPTFCNIIPGAELSDPVPLVNLELKEASDSDKSPTILTDKSEITLGARQVTVLTCLAWGPGKNSQPPPSKELVKFWMESEKIRRGKGPTLVLCHDGIEACGLFLALSFLLERMAVEKVCDIMFAVRAIRRSRKEFVRSLEQFKYLYDAAAEYVKSVENYAPSL